MMILTLFWKIALVVACGFADRIRGSAKPKIPGALKNFIYGLMIAAILGSEIYWTWFVCGGLWIAGESFGWGEPIGAAVMRKKMNPANYEDWQIGPLKKNVWLALAARGAIWGFFPSLLTFFDLRYLLCMSMTLVFPLACWIDRNYEIVTGPWEEQEYLRGWGVAIVMLLGWLFIYL